MRERLPHALLLHGPVGIGKLQYQLLQMDDGWRRILAFMVLFNVNLAVLNMMPFPALDGGRLVIVAIEAIRRKDLDYQKVAIVNLVGFVLLISLMLLLTFHDIKNLFN